MSEGQGCRHCRLPVTWVPIQNPTESVSDSGAAKAMPRRLVLPVLLQLTATFFTAANGASLTSVPFVLLQRRLLGFQIVLSY